MVFQDRSLVCAECGDSFAFSADDQRYHMERGYTDPKRCPTCRQARRTDRGQSGYDSGPRQMYPVVCAECGANTEVPFQPTGARPVYCTDCYQKRRRESNY